MSDYEVRVSSKADLSDLDKAQQFLDKLTNKTHQIKVEAKVTGLDGLDITKQIQAQMRNAAKVASQSFNNSFTVSKFTPNVIDYANMKKQIKKETSDIAKIMHENLDDISKDDSKKWAKNYVSDRQKAYNKDQQNRLKEQEAINKAVEKAEQEASIRREQAEKTRISQAQKRANEEAKVNERWQKNLLASEQKFAKEQEQIQQKNFANTQKNNESLKKVQVRQQIAQMKYNAEQKNAKSSAWVETGKSNIERLKQDQQNRLKEQEEFLKIQRQLDSDKYSSNLSNMRSKLSVFNGQDSDSIKNAKAAIDAYDSSLTKIKNHFDSNNPFELNFDEMQNELQSMELSFDKFRNNMSIVQNDMSESLRFDQITSARYSFDSYFANNTKAAKKYTIQISELRKQLESMSTVEDKIRFEDDFKKLKSEISLKGDTGKSPIDELKRGFGQIAQFTGVYGVLQQIPEAFMKVGQSVYKTDVAMTNLRMATNVSNTEAKNLMNTYSQMGKQLKATATDVATSATEYLKQGETIKESQKLAKDTIVLSKISGLSSEDATKTITAARKSYDLKQSQVMDFVDQISAIDMESATDVGGLATAFNEVAANARNAGVEIQQLLAYAAAIGETTQEGMASVGTSLNAIFSRMGNIKLSRLKDFETGEDLSNVETVLKGVGIQLRDSASEFRDFDEVLDETASKWDSFSGVQQRAVASAFAGTNHMNSFLVLMQQWENVQKYIQTADDSSGKAMEKYEHFQDSLQGSLDGFENSFQSLSNTAVSSDFLKGAIDTGTGFLNVLDFLIDKVGILNGVLAGVGAAKGITSFVKNFDKSAGNSKDDLKIIPRYF